MAEHSNVEMCRRGYEAFAKADMATLAEMFAEDIVWHVPGNTPISGDLRGRDAVFAHFGRLAELTGGTFRIELHDVLANDEHAVVLAQVTASRQGKQANWRDANIFHVKSGKVTEFWSFAEDTRAVDEFWS